MTFPDGYLADLYTESVRGDQQSRPGCWASGMLLQAFERLSGRAACDRLEVDLRWQAAAEVDVGAAGLHPTVLAGMRNLLRAWPVPAGCSRAPRSWPGRPGQ